MAGRRKRRTGLVLLDDDDEGFRSGESEGICLRNCAGLYVMRIDSFRSLCFAKMKVLVNRSLWMEVVAVVESFSACRDDKKNVCLLN